jgi:superoxide reductase
MMSHVIAAFMQSSHGLNASNWPSGSWFFGPGEWFIRIQCSIQPCFSLPKAYKIMIGSRFACVPNYVFLGDLAMSSRREFMRRASAMVPAGAAGIFLATGADSVAEEAEQVGSILGKLPKNIIYTKANEGVWKGKGGSHLPYIEVANKKGEIINDHGMSPEHYIVRHTLVSPDGEVIFGHTFAPTDEEAVSEFDGSKIDAGKTYYALSFCNKHDLWLAEVKI